MNAIPEVETAKKPSPVTVAALSALKKADGDVRKATELMLAAVRKSRALRDALTEPLLATACYAAVTMQRRQQRQHIWTAPGYTAGGHGQRVIALATTLLSFPLPGGLKLAEATRAQVAAAADFYATQASDMHHKARWLRLVAAAVPEDGRVADVLDETRLEAMRTEASNAQ